MGTAAMRVGEAMGWLIERARQRRSNLKAAGTIASLAWKDSLQGELNSGEALANRLRRLDEGKGADWWLEAKGKPYLEAVAAVLKASAEELASWIMAARPKEDDDARWFRFEVFPALRPLDLDTEDPFPGVPRQLLLGDGPTSLTWWRSPPGAGRTLVGRWLARRHRWSIASPQSVAERTLVEQDSDEIPGVGAARRVTVASPQPMPQHFRELGGAEVVTPKDWALPLLKWVEGRLESEGLYDADQVEALVRRGLVHADTPGQLLEQLADVHTLGVGALTDDLPPNIRLQAWARAHAHRGDRSARRASRAYLAEHGASLLCRAELARRRLGLPVTPETVARCLPVPAPAPADAIQAAHDAGDVEGALKLILPRPSDLVEAMRELRWLTQQGWGFPTRVTGWLHQCVAAELVEGDDLGALGAVGDAPDMVRAVLDELANPHRWSAWTRRLTTVAELDADAALGLDALVHAMVLSESRGHVVDDAERSALRAAVLRLAGAEGAGVTLGVDRRWSALAWLSLFAPGQPPSEVDRIRVFGACNLLDAAETDPAAPLPLRLLAATRLGEVAAADPEPYSPYLPACAVADLAAGRAQPSDAMDRLAQIRHLSVVERLAQPWASTLEAVAEILWPVWERWGIPEDPDLARLSRVWATSSAERVAGTLGQQLVQHARRGVDLPEALWHVTLNIDGFNIDLLQRAPSEVLFARADGGNHRVQTVLWQRDPAGSMHRVAELIQAGASVGSWLLMAPPEHAPELLAVLERSPGTTREMIAWADQVIAERVPGWRDVWRWRMGGRSASPGSSSTG